MGCVLNYKVAEHLMKTERFVLPRLVYSRYIILIIGLFTATGIIFTTINTYHKYLIEKKCDPEPKKYKLLLTVEILCLIAEIMIVLI